MNLTDEEFQIIEGDFRHFIQDNWPIKIEDDERLSIIKKKMPYVVKNEDGLWQCTGAIKDQHLLLFYKAEYDWYYKSYWKMRDDVQKAINQ